jgi:hypothetical protein
MASVHARARGDGPPCLVLVLLFPLSFSLQNCEGIHSRIAARQGRFAMSVAFLRRLLPALALVAQLWPILSSLSAPPTPPTTFPTENEAQQRCPDDLVVWLDLPSRIYHYRGQQRYGATPGGAYVCRNEAKGAGMRATRTTQ